jgi:hypothetical protein
MMMKIFAILLFTFICFGASAQEKKEIFTTKFKPQTITYNGSPNPNECWESVAHGIEIWSGKAGGFFTMPRGKMDELKTIIDTNEVIIEVVYYEEPYDDSGEDGSVLKITMNGKVIYNALKQQQD